MLPINKCFLPKVIIECYFNYLSTWWAKLFTNIDCVSLTSLDSLHLFLSFQSREQLTDFIFKFFICKYWCLQNDRNCRRLNPLDWYLTLSSTTGGLSRYESSWHSTDHWTRTYCLFFFFSYGGVMGTGSNWGIGMNPLFLPLFMGK